MVAIANATQKSDEVIDAKALLSESFYDELHEVAESLLEREAPDCLLQSTILVNEAFMTLRREHNLQLDDRPVMLATAARTMRRRLLERARSRRQITPGSRRTANRLGPLLPADAPAEEIVAIHEAVGSLRERSELTADIVEMSFFGGMSRDEIAQLTGLSKERVRREWRRAKAWINEAIATESHAA